MRRLFSAIALLAVLVAGAPALQHAAPAELAAAPAAVAVPVTPAGLPAGIEDLASYVGQSSCDLRSWGGTIRLAQLLVNTYPATSYGTNYSCGTNGNPSEHYEGRAIDWMISARDKTQASQAAAVINWLLATDKAGHTFAMARRLGIMYLIWNNKTWGSWSGKWEPYENCATRPLVGDDSYCHRNHVHISLGYNGAVGRTSFWSKKVFNVTDYGPCRVQGLNWAGPYVTYHPGKCIRFASVAAPSGSNPMFVNLIRYSGAMAKPGDRGPVVSAIQAGLRLPADGLFGPATSDRVKMWQSKRKLAVTGTATAQFWLSLLNENRPRV